MSTVGSETVFLSALQPHTTVTTYGLPSDIQLGNGGAVSDEVARARRVQQQVQMRLAEKTSTLPRQNGSASQYAMSDYGGSSTMKYQSSSYTPNYSSKSSYMYAGSKTMGPRLTQRGFSSQSTGGDMANYHRITVGGGGGGGGCMGGGGGGSMVGGGGGSMVGGGGGGGFYREEMRMVGGHPSMARPHSRIEGEMLSMNSMRQPVNPWMVDSSDVGSMVSERDGVYRGQHSQMTMNGYSQSTGSAMGFGSTLPRSLSGTLSRGGGMGGGEDQVFVQQQQQQHAYKGPAHRTISRITAGRKEQNRMSTSSMYSTMQQGAMDTVDNRGGFIAGSQGNLFMQQRPALSRAASIKSMHSVGRGMDIYGQMDMENMAGLSSLDMPTALQHLRTDDYELQVLGAAYIQHECYNDNEAKNEVRRLKGVGDLVALFNSESQEVQRFATGATRNLIYESMENKVALIEEDGIPELVKALKEPDDELRKNITGILWNLSSKDSLKEKLARETLSELTEQILIPMSGSADPDAETEGKQSVSQSDTEIFCNTTGCLRNLSSVNEKTRQRMRETRGLVDSLVGYIRTSLDDSKAEDKGVENSACVLRNLSYQLYQEIPPSALMRLEGPTRDQDSGKGEAIGCFTPQSRKAKNSKNQDLSTFSEVAKVPKGMEWLWHPQIVGVYNRLLHKCEINSTTREAAAGALQNITAGDKRWASMLSRVALEQERILPVVLDLLRTERDLELRSLTGLLRNLSRHARDKNDMAPKVVNNLVTKLPEDGHQKEPSSEVVVNICGVLNNLVTSSSVAARDITFFNGIQKLVGIKNTHDSSPGRMKAAKAASTVLSNMFQYKKLHKSFKSKGFSRADFQDVHM